MRPEVAQQIANWLASGRLQFAPAEFSVYQLAMQELQQEVLAGSNQEMNDGSDSKQHEDQAGGE